MRRPLLACALALLALAGCGSGKAPAPPRAAVHLDFAGPSDGESVRAETVVVRGTVRPSSSLVRVRGERVPVSGGSFSATVSLAAGTNVIDVLASAAGARPAMTALRVRRLVTVRVPDVTGDVPDQATERLAGLGLEARVERAGGVFDALLPGDPVVCETDPSPGDEVDAGTTVRLLVAKGC